MFLPKLGTQVGHLMAETVRPQTPPKYYTRMKTGTTRQLAFLKGMVTKEKANRGFFRCGLFSTPRILLVPDRSLLWESRTMRIPFGRPLGLRLLIISMCCNTEFYLFPTIRVQCH